MFGKRTDQLSDCSLPRGRNHRERKEKYIKSLEREVLRLREDEAAIVQESKNVQEENKILKEIMTRYGIELPDTRMHTNATVSVYGSSTGALQMRVDMPGADLYKQHGEIQVSPNSNSMSNASPSTTVAPAQMHMHPEFEQSQSEGLSLTQRSATSDRSHTTAFPGLSHSDNSQEPDLALQSGGLDAPEIGIDFVLSYALASTLEPR